MDGVETQRVETHFLKRNVNGGRSSENVLWRQMTNNTAHLR